MSGRVEYSTSSLFAFKQEHATPFFYGFSWYGVIYTGNTIKHLNVRKNVKQRLIELRQTFASVHVFLTYETEFVLFLAVQENSVLPMGGTTHT